MKTPFIFSRLKTWFTSLQDDLSACSDLRVKKQIPKDKGILLLNVSQFNSDWNIALCEMTRKEREEEMKACKNRMR